MIVGVGVEEVLRDRRVGARLDLLAKMVQVVRRGSRLWMHFRIGPDFDMKVASVLFTHEPHEIGCIAELAQLDHARRLVAAQGDQAPDAGRAIAVEDLGGGLPGRADA